MRESYAVTEISTINDRSSWRVRGGVATELLYAQPSGHTPPDLVIN
jgi:hypothetical protein